MWFLQTRKQELSTKYIYKRDGASLIKFCLNISEEYGLFIPTEIKALWSDIVENTYIPMSDKLPDSNGELLHLEYETYNGDSAIKLMLHYYNIHYYISMQMIMMNFS